MNHGFHKRFCLADAGLGRGAVDKRAKGSGSQDLALTWNRWMVRYGESPTLSMEKKVGLSAMKQIRRCASQLATATQQLCTVMTKTSEGPATSLERRASAFAPGRLVVFWGERSRRLAGEGLLRVVCSDFSLVHTRRQQSTTASPFSHDVADCVAHGCNPHVTFCEELLHSSFLPFRRGDMK